MINTPPSETHLRDHLNVCEKNVCKHFLENFRREHPHLKVIFVKDDLSSTAPNIEMIEEHGLKYIFVAQTDDHQFLLEQLESNKDKQYYEVKGSDGTYHQFHFINGISLNKSNMDVKVNLIEYQQTAVKDKKTNCWPTTNTPVTISSIMTIVQGRRTR